MTIDLTREGMLEELKNGNAVIMVEDAVEARELGQMTGIKPSEVKDFFYKGEDGLGFYEEVTIDPFYIIYFLELAELPSYREPMIELSKEIVGTKDKFIEDLKNGEAELEAFGIPDKAFVATILGINPKSEGPYLYLDKETQELKFHKELSDKPIVLDMKRFLELQ